MTFEELKYTVPNSVIEMYNLNNDYKLATYMKNNPSLYSLDMESYNWVVNHSQLNRRVLDFISQFVQHEGDEGQETIRHLFSAGYCWHFAHILKDAFNCGTVCNAYPFSHMVWVDHIGLAYDIYGMYEGDQLYFIPESYFGNKILGFRHISGVNSDITREELREVGLKYCEDNGFEFNEIGFLELTRKLEED